MAAAVAAPGNVIIKEDGQVGLEAELIKEVIDAGKFAIAKGGGVPPETNDGSVTRAFLWNSNKNDKDFVLYDKHNWAGVENGLYPFADEIQGGKHILFFHQGPLPIGGSKAGVVYADGKDSTARKWLVAFDSVANKIFVEAGPIGPTDWNVVEVKLNASGSESSYEDPVYHGKAHAEFRVVNGLRYAFIRFTD